MRKSPSRGRRASAAVALSLAVASLNASAGLFDKVLGRPDPSEPLPPEKAFRIKVEAIDRKTVIATLTPAPEHYLYRKTVRFAAKDAKGVRLAGMVLPNGTKKQDPFFGETEVYTQPVQVTLPLERAAGVPASLSVVVFYQGCNGRLGVCYPPSQAEFPIRLP